MDIRECYRRLGGSYEEILSRLLKQERVERFLRRFPDDKTYDELEAAIAEHRDEDAFRAAHTLKGVCQNLGLERLHLSSMELTETLRGGPHGDVMGALEKVREDYRITMDAIREWEASC